MDYPFRHDRIKFYRYRFLGIEKPVTIEARNRASARDMIERMMSTLPEEYKQSRIVGESVFVPLTGTTEKTKNGEKYIWVGETHSKDGWMREAEFKVKFKNK